MTIDLTNPIYHDADKAREHLEKLQWPDGPICPHCGNVDQDRITKLKGKSTRPGVYKCNECAKPFSVTVGTVFERSHIPLNKWLLAVHLITSSKKGMSAHQLYRMLGFGSYRTAWFMMHRIRHAIADTNKGGMGGPNKVVEADETYVGGKAKNRAYAKEPPKKEAVFSLVERGGKVRSRHVADVTAATLRNAIVTQADRKSHLMTDEAGAYVAVGKEFAGHSSVNHSADEYVRLGGFVHTNTAENYFSILKRGIYGVYHHVSEAHLHRYLAEFDFRYSNRSGLGVEDNQRAAKALEGIRGKRLTYRGTDQAANA
jgi:transposase-like protein